MGLVYADIEIINTGDIELAERSLMPKSDIRKVEVKALVDSGAYMMAINEDIMIQLGLRKIDQKEAVMADGSVRLLDIVGPIDIRFKNRSTTVRAMLLPSESEVLLGAIPMEDMDVVIDPKQQTLIVNPSTPYIPKMALK